jgi:peptidyl-dipeptidase Dcp
MLKSDLPKDELLYWNQIENRLGRWEERDFPSELKRAAEGRRVRKQQRLLEGGEVTFSNTILFLEDVDLDFGRIASDFHGLNGVVKNEKLSKMEESVSEIEDQENQIDLRDDRWPQRVRELVATKSSLGSREGALLEDYYRGFEDSGCYLNKAKRDALIIENSRLSKLELTFGQAIDKEARHVLFSRKGDLQGLEEEEIEASGEEARRLGKSGWAVRLEPTVCQDISKRLNKTASKLKITRAVSKRGKGVEKIIVKIAKSRLKIANILGFSSWADFKLKECHAEKSSNVWRALQKCLPGVQQMAKGDMETAKNNGWSPENMTEDDLWAFLPGGRSRPSFDPLRVLEEGCFEAGRLLFDLSFEPITGLHFYHPDTLIYRARDKNKTLGFLAVDLWQREGKDNGAWAMAWEDRRTNNSFPLVSMCFNFTKNAKCDFEGVSTIFHEFGHALHSLFTSESYPSHVGLECSNDFVETPSQLAEYWARDPWVYDRYRSPDCPELGEIIDAGATPGVGLGYLASIISAGTDLIWHSERAGLIESPSEVDADAQKFLTKEGGGGGPRYKSSYFEHIFNCGYDSSYYSYLWCELKAGQIYEWVRKNGGLCREVGDTLYKDIYSIDAGRAIESRKEVWKTERPKLFFQHQL